MTRLTVLYARTYVLIRDKPDSKSTMLFTIVRGDSVEVEPGVRAELDHTGWVRVRYQEGRVGWCERHLLTESPPRTR